LHFPQEQYLEFLCFERTPVLSLLVGILTKSLLIPLEGVALSCDILFFDLESTEVTMLYKFSLDLGSLDLNRWTGLIGSGLLIPCEPGVLLILEAESSSSSLVRS
jgi:hypothetical protein